MKYVIMQDPNTGFILPVVFDEQLIHAYMARACLMSIEARAVVVSAGFVFKNGAEWEVGSKRSESLNIGPGEEDKAILNLFLVEGLSGLDLCNYLAYLRIQAGKEV